MRVNLTLAVADQLSAGMAWLEFFGFAIKEGILLAWNFVDEDGAAIPLEAEAIAAKVPTDLLNAFVDELRKAQQAARLPKLTASA